MKENPGNPEEQKKGVDLETKTDPRTGRSDRWSYQRHRAGDGFAERGAKVVVAGRSLSALTELVREIQSRGDMASAQEADVSQYDQLIALANRAVELYGRIDTWVHVAAVSIHAPFQETRPDEFRRLIDVNLIGQAFGAMAALPHLKRAGGGALIHIGSVESKRSFPLHSAHSASKHGMIGFIDALRVELMHDRTPISVTTILPAGINTPFFDKSLTRLGVKSTWEEQASRWNGCNAWRRTWLTVR